MQNGDCAEFKSFIEARAEEIGSGAELDRSRYDEYGVKWGLRNPDGTGVMAGVTRVGNVSGYYVQDGERCPMPGRLTYRGIDVSELVSGFTGEGRLGFEETAYLLVFGSLPDKTSLEEFSRLLASFRELPDGFTEDMILAAPSKNIMNKLSRSVLALYSYDSDPETYGGKLSSELEKALRLIARCPVIVAHALAAKRHYYDGEGLFLRRSDPALSTAENLLRLVRFDGKYTKSEAAMLDLCLVLHAEHGGGNNSAFACRVLTSSGTDIYSAIAAAVGSLKGARHGGANGCAEDMLLGIEENVRDWKDDGEVKAYLRRIVRREAGAGDGLIYGMGHAIYTLSDPRAVQLKAMARKLADEKNMTRELDLIESVERLTPDVLRETRERETAICANVDLYSGFVYRMLDIPRDLYTPLFAVSRMAGWCAHRLEESGGNGKIIRPAYKAIEQDTVYVPLDGR